MIPKKNVYFEVFWHWLKCTNCMIWFFFQKYNWKCKLSTVLWTVIQCQKAIGITWEKNTTKSCVFYKQYICSVQKRTFLSTGKLLKQKFGSAILIFHSITTKFCCWDCRHEMWLLEILVQVLTALHQLSGRVHKESSWLDQLTPQDVYKLKRSQSVKYHNPCGTVQPVNGL